MKAINKKQSGFTLIELIMVIVILGILSAFALPKFADLGGDARTSALKGGMGAVKSAAAITHAAWLAGGSTGTSIDLEGSTTVALSTEGYPTAAAAGIVVAAQIVDDYTITGAGVISLNPAIADCVFTYTASTGVVSALDTDGC